jgi:hypothetical protein
MRIGVRFLAILVVVLGRQAFAFETSGLHKGMTYQETKIWQEKFLAGTPTKAEQVEAMRSIIKTSKVGERGLKNIFKNFEGQYAIDPTIPGVWKSVLMQKSPSAAQVKGYRRELLYASAIYSDKRFELKEMNAFRKRPWGNTDADIVFRHKASGLSGRIEVKDYSISSQVTNREDLKRQIDKMAKEARYTGQIQFWMNRRDAHPEIKRYASEKGVIVLDNVKTGHVTKGLLIDEAMNRVEWEMLRKDRARTVLSRGQAAFGAWTLVDAAPKVWGDVKAISNSNDRSIQTWLRMGEHGSNALAGGGMVLSDGALTASKFAADNMQGRLYRMGRAGGIASVAALGLGEAFLISRYATGDVSSQEFWTTQWVMTSSAGGGLGGGWIGGAAAVLSPVKNPFWGAAIGSAGGAWIGREFGERTSTAYYEWNFGKLDREFGKFVYARYGVQ